MVRVTFLLFDGFSNMVLSCLLEPLRALRDQTQAEIGWQVITPNDMPAVSSSGLSIAADTEWRNAGRMDMLVVVAGYGFRDHANAESARVLRALARQSDIVLGADTGAWLLADAGLLNEKSATIHWTVLADFEEQFPDIRMSHDGYVKTGRIWSCGGASSALDLMLAFISERFGPASAFLVSTMFLQDAERPQAEDRGPGMLAGRGSARLRQVVNLMVETIETPLPLVRLAGRVGLSVRSLDRLFQEELGMAPGRYYQMMRLSHARELAAGTRFTLREIALRCGYSDAAALSKAFRRTFGHPIRKSL
ncbi:GlxA family transcriptional regulator [Roseibium aggregatum]|uniref:GlxA family transcriptional regulator n=1 Tax=Roseibium aggregatum TaxID=187304 RepID=A0A926P0A0_9HYPH|nr:GlxA family transcriptional regulator [Roseibium aggregatum]MBD1547576.1 GlxA family transcriptional regulator [Roseibium aggregatum]